jgi:hypothetical protein
MGDDDQPLHGEAVRAPPRSGAESGGFRVARTMAQEYGSEHADRQRNVIHDIPVFIGRASKLIEAMTSGERKLKGRRIREDH